MIATRPLAINADALCLAVANEGSLAENLLRTRPLAYTWVG